MISKQEKQSSINPKIGNGDGSLTQTGSRKTRTNTDRKMASHALAFHPLSDTHTVNNSNERSESWWERNPLVLTGVECGERERGGARERETTADSYREKERYMQLAYCKLAFRLPCSMSITLV